MLKDSYGIDGDESFVGLLRISDTIVVFFSFSPPINLRLFWAFTDRERPDALERGRGAATLWTNWTNTDAKRLIWQAFTLTARHDESECEKKWRVSVSTSVVDRRESERFFGL
jgi:hypothetical protein